MTDLLTVISVLFIVAGPFVLLANHLKLPTAPALIVAGIVAGFAIDEQLALEVARLGIALLVFTFAVRIQATDAESIVPDSDVVAIVLLVVLGGVGFAGGIGLGLPPAQAMFLGITVALSSSIVGSTLFLPGNLEPAHDRLSESIHAIQDFFGLFLLVVLSAGTFALDPVATQVGYGFLLLALAVAINRYLYDLIGRLANGSDESMLIGTVALLIVFLGLAEYAELSIVVGAFAAGFAVRDDYVTYSGVINGIDSITDFFAAIFFLTIGALLTVPSVDELLMAGFLVVLAGVLKPALTIALLQSLEYERRTATLTAFNLDQISEFALIIAIEALILGLILQSVFDAILLAAAITLITSSFTRYYEEDIYHLLADHGLLGNHEAVIERWSSVPEPLEDHVVIIGYGRHGRRLVELCEARDQQYVVVENNPAVLDDLAVECESYVFGDVIEQDTGVAAGFESAKLLISTPDARPVNDHLVSFADTTDVILRTKHSREATTYLDKGAIYVSVTDLLAADRLAERFDDLFEGVYDLEDLRDELLDEAAPHRRIPRRERSGTGLD